MNVPFVKYLDYNHFRKLKTSYKVFFYSICFWYLFLIFLFFIRVNPFSFFSPVYFYILLKKEQAKPTQIYGIDRDGDLILLQRNLILGETFYQKIYTLIGEISRFTVKHEFLEKQENIYFIKKLINLQTAILSIWKYKNTCIIYLKSSILVEIISSRVNHLDYRNYNLDKMTMKERESAILKKRKKTLEDTLYVLEKTVLLLFSEIKKVEFKFDTKKIDFL